MLQKEGTILPPKKPSNLPPSVQWLSGQGAGVWFCIDKTAKKEEFLIRRFTPSGKLDCERIFIIESNHAIFDIEKTYKFTHISHCAKCRIIQKGITFIFNYKKEN